MKTIIVQSDEICNPLIGERIHLPIVSDEHYKPMDEVRLGMQSFYDENAGLAVAVRYHVRIILANLVPVPGSPTPKGNWFDRMNEAIHKYFWAGQSPEPKAQSLTSYRWSLLCEPIEDAPPIAPRMTWRVGFHQNQWCSVTVPGDVRIYCIKRSNLFREFGYFGFMEECQCPEQA